MTSRLIPTMQSRLDAVVRPPGSKSITNRALVCAALAKGTSVLRGALVSDDTEVMIACLQQLGIEVGQQNGGATLEVRGCAGELSPGPAELFVKNSGTTIRFLTPVCALGQGRYLLDGIPRMRERPIGDLLQALQQLGVDARGRDQAGYPPVLVHGTGLDGGEAVVGGNISSQFLSGLLMAVAAAQGTTKLQVAGELVSVPYVEMTMAVMRSFGASVAASEAEFEVRPGGYVASDYLIEADASAASYFWAAAAVTGGRVTVRGLTQHALQGDVKFCECLARMGCQVDYGAEGITVTGGPLRGIDVDMRDISDTAQTLAVVALFAEGKTHIRNVGNIRFKETDRLAALAAELQKLGAIVIEHEDGIEVTPGTSQPASIATYDDHRMAMSFAVAGLRIEGVVIEDPGCVAKTYPHFFEDFTTLYD
ncbi:MAG: 3-phosphoshikimate 1-carboxyvinyltransferase [Planctomycetota bacterium]